MLPDSQPPKLMLTDPRAEAATVFALAMLVRKSSPFTHGGCPQVLSPSARVICTRRMLHWGHAALTMSMSSAVSVSPPLVSSPTFWLICPPFSSVVMKHGDNPVRGKVHAVKAEKPK